MQDTVSSGLSWRKNIILLGGVTVVSVITSGVTFGLIHYHLRDYQKNSAHTETTREISTIEITNQTIPDMVEEVSPAVVSIIISADVPIIENYFESYDPFESFFGGGFGFSIPRQRQIGTERKEIGGGTGFFVSAEGHIVTNKHVVNQDGVKYSVVTNDGEAYEVEILAKDPSLDIAILKVKSNNSFPFLSFGDSNKLRRGESVVAIGNALAEFPNSVSVGVISGLSRDIIAGDGRGFTEALEGVIQTDAAINQGNSGGPLLNTSGEVIGVNVATAQGSENIGFAIPSALVTAVYESVAEHGEIIRPFLGVRYVQIDEVMAKKNNLPHDYGVLIIRGEDRTDLAVLPGSAADKAGLEENDIILEFAGTKLDGTQSLEQLIRKQDVGDTVMLKIIHDGEEKEVRIALDKAPTE